MMIFALIMCFTISPKLACIFLVAIPVLGFLLIFIAKKAHPNFETVFKKYDSLNRVVQEDVSGIRVVKAYAKEDYEKEKFKKVNDEVYYFFKKAEKIVAFNSPVMQLTVYTCILLAVCATAALTADGPRMVALSLVLSRFSALSSTSASVCQHTSDTDFLVYIPRRHRHRGRHIEDHNTASQSSACQLEESFLGDPSDLLRQRTALFQVMYRFLFSASSS